MLRKVLAGAAVATVLAVGGVAVAGALSAPAKSSHHAKRSAAGSLGKLAIATAAKTIGVDVDTLRAGVRSGHTIAQIAEQHHVSPSTVVHAIVTRLDAAIDAAVKAHKLDATRAAKLKQRVPAFADRLVNHTTGGRRIHHKAAERYHVRQTLAAAAHAVGISYDSLIQGLHAHKTIAAIARAHGVDPAKVIAAMVSVAERNFDAYAKHHRVHARYRKQIPTIVRNFVNGTTSWRPHYHRAGKAA